MLGDPVRGRPREAKPAAKKTIKTVRMVEVPKRAAAPDSRRIWIAGGAVALVLVIAWLVFAPARKDEGPTPPSPGTGANGAAAGESANLPLTAPGGSPDTVTQGRTLGFIRTVRLQPSQPNRMDTLKAEVTAVPDAPSRLTYTYAWKVNDRVIEDAKEDALKLSDFKKGDRISVTVTPSDGSTAGFAAVSPEIAVHGIPPTLDLEIKGPAGSGKAPPDLQLVSVAPDSTQVTFSLAPPLVPGMTIDKRSGKISWPRPPDLKGAFRFVASVEDDNGTKVTRTFEITIK